MKPLMIFLAAACAIIFVYSVYNFVNSDPTAYYADQSRGLDEPTTNQQLKQLRATFSQKINTSRKSAEDYSTYSMWLSLIATAITGLSTLVASVNVAKTNTDVNVAKTSAESSKKTVAIIAALTFVSTVIQSANTKVSEVEMKHAKTCQELKDLRNEFTAKYQVESDDLRKTQIIEFYEDRINDN
jgi:hypothetical protein